MNKEGEYIMTKELIIFINIYILKLNHIVENGDKRYLRENLRLVINYMNEHLEKILLEYNNLESKENKHE